MSAPASDGLRRPRPASPDGWFTVEPLSGDTFAISEYRHWEEPHCYLLLGGEIAALIDTGLGVSDLRPVVEGLTGLPVLVLTTHAHWDHIGGHRHFTSIAVHPAERDWLAVRFPLPPAEVRRNLLAQPCAFPPGFDPEDYQVFQGQPQMLLRDGERIDLGGRVLQVIHTPGHSPGHCCFYEAARGDLYAGDLIYRGCLDAFYPTTDPRQFWASVQKVRRLNPARIFPGHHRLDLSPGLVDKIEAAFADLDQRGLLRTGAGRFDFGAFQIHI